MKKYLLAAFLFTSSAFASYNATHCSNADGTLQWRNGHNDNLLIKNEDGQEKAINVNLLKINFQNEVVLREETNNDCKVSQVYSYTKIWAATAVITPAKPFPQTETTFNKLIQDEVICRRHANSLMYCP